MPIIPSVIKWLNSNRLDQIEKFRKYPVETQNAILYKLLAKAAATEWGIKHGYSSINSVKEYQNRFPVQHL